MKKVDLAHFRTHGNNTVISFSGGRTSGFLLYHVLKAHGGELPDNTVVLFQNTGKERVETLDFIQEVGDRWKVPIVWLEWRNEKPRYRQVNHTTASRNGEPFEELITVRSYLPNPIARLCTYNLKVKTCHEYIKHELEWDEWDMMVGIRHDEPRRWKVEMHDEKRPNESRHIPLRHAGVDESDVLEFWEAQPFDLKLKRYEGNCDLCYLKGRAKRMLIMEENPELADWWVEQETRMGANFRKDGTYAQLLDYSKRQLRLPLFDDPTDLGECLCHD